jgi:hypothetical protein
MNRDPFTKSAPATRAATKSGISPGSLLPSASRVTMMSPLAAANPQASALPFPARVCRTMTASGHSNRATSTVRSSECPSTTTISSTSAPIPATPVLR